MEMDGNLGNWTSSEGSGVEDNSRGFVEQGKPEREIQNLQISAKWTDEKHSLYLNSMEASFVEQMHNCEDHKMNFHNLLPRKGRVLEPNTKHSNRKGHLPSSQFKVLRRGYWERINFGRVQTPLNICNESHLLFANPWILHFRPVSTAEELQEMHSSNLQQDGLLSSNTNCLHRKKPGTVTCGVAANSDHSPHYYSDNYHQDSFDCNTEVSDQNFVDEDCREEQLSSSCRRKWVDITGADVSIKDQVVPFGGSPTTASSSKDGTQRKN